MFSTIKPKKIKKGENEDVLGQSVTPCALHQAMAMASERIC